MRQVRSKGWCWCSLLLLLLGAVWVDSSVAEARGQLATVQLDSIPPGAKVVVGSQEVGTTPTRLQVPPGRPVRFTLLKPGYQPEQVELSPLAPGKVTRVTFRLRQQR